MKLGEPVLGSNGDTASSPQGRTESGVGETVKPLRVAEPEKEI